MKMLPCFPRFAVLLFLPGFALAQSELPPVPPLRATFNYAEALQKSLYFYEAQQSGKLTPNNRVAWRGDSNLADGQDIGRDLSGGLYDAGDHWKANLTIAFAGMSLAWSGTEEAKTYAKIGQLDELVETLLHVNTFFMRCVINPSAPAEELDIILGVGGREGVPSPKVHDMWAPAEVAHLMTNRPTFGAAPEAPGADIAAAMASSLASGSMVLRLPETAKALRGKRGYENFNPVVLADRWLQVAEKLTDYAEARRGPPLTDSLGEAEKARIQKMRTHALRWSDKEIVEIGYRGNPIDQVLTALTWVQRAKNAQSAKAPQTWLERAENLYLGDFKAEQLDGFWRDYGIGLTGKLATYNLMLLRPDVDDYHYDLQHFAHSYLNYKRTPGGLILREWWAHQWGSLRHTNNNGAIVLHYAAHIQKAPPLSGNLWWKTYPNDKDFADRMVAMVKSQVDYALGANPYGRSYLVGFGQNPFNHPHHRGAYGAWAGNHHFIPGKLEYRPDRCRHVLYGALIAGPDHNDVFINGAANRSGQDMDDGKGGKEWVNTYRVPGRDGWISARDYKISPKEALQLVMDAQYNEVAIDYNAGITASFARLTALGLSKGLPLPDNEFPPRERRDESLDPLTTDREFFVIARRLDNDPTATQAEFVVYNRSRWPARVTKNLSFRVYFTLEGSAQLDDVKAELVEGGDHGAVVGMPTPAGREREAYVEVSFPDRQVFPGDRDRAHDYRQATVRISAPGWATSNDWSLARLGDKPALIAELPVYDSGRRVGGAEPAAP